MSNYNVNNNTNKENLKNFMDTILAIAKMRNIWIDGNITLSEYDNDIKFHWRSKGYNNPYKEIADTFGLSVPEVMKIVNRHFKKQVKFEITDAPDSKVYVTNAPTVKELTPDKSE